MIISLQSRRANWYVGGGGGGGGRNGSTPGKPPDTPTSRTWLASHVASEIQRPYPLGHGSRPRKFFLAGEGQKEIEAEPCHD